MLQIIPVKTYGKSNMGVVVLCLWELYSWGLICLTSPCFAVSSTFLVFTTDHPDVRVSPLNGTTVTESDANVILMCSAKGEPKNYTFSWIQYAPDGITQIKEYSPARVHDGNAYLAFANISHMNSGVYHCFAENGIEDYKTGMLKATNNTVLVVKGRLSVKIQNSVFAFYQLLRRNRILIFSSDSDAYA